MKGGRGQLRKPNLPDGPLKDLNDALHEMQRRAGRPSLRELKQVIKDEKLLSVPPSHASIYDVFSDKRLPRCDLLLAIVQAIADLAPGFNCSLSPAGESERFYQLWLAAEAYDHRESVASGRDRPESDATIAASPVFPVYMVVEESDAVAGAPIADLNAGILHLCGEIASDPVVADKMRFCLIGFSSQAHVLLPLANLSEIGSLPGLVAEGPAAYGAAFDLLRATIDRDATDLRASGCTVLRPYVFFLAASQPSDPQDWPAAHERATDPAWQYHPNILACGFRNADRDTIQRIATVRAVLSPETNPVLVLREFTRSLVQSVARSVVSPAPSGGIRVVMSDELPGYTVVNADPA